MNRSRPAPGRCGRLRAAWGQRNGRGRARASDLNTTISGGSSRLIALSVPQPDATRILARNQSRAFTSPLMNDRSRSNGETVPIRMSEVALA